MFPGCFSAAVRSGLVEKCAGDKHPPRRRHGNTATQDCITAPLLSPCVSVALQSAPVKGETSAASRTLDRVTPERWRVANKGRAGGSDRPLKFFGKNLHLLAVYDIMEVVTGLLPQR